MLAGRCAQRNSQCAEALARLFPMQTVVVLNADEIDELFRQAPAHEVSGGFQTFLVRLQLRLNPGSHELMLREQDLGDISGYAFDFKQVDWQTRLVAIFGRTLGAHLGR